MMVDEVIGNVKSARKNVDIDFQIWYQKILDLAEKLGIVEAIQAYRGIAQTLPVLFQLIITKKSVAVSLLDSLIIQMQDRFSDEDRHARHFT